MVASRPQRVFDEMEASVPDIVDITGEYGLQN
jgi:hypothetical protein